MVGGFDYFSFIHACAINGRLSVTQAEVSTFRVNLDIAAGTANAYCGALGADGDA